MLKSLNNKEGKKEGYWQVRNVRTERLKVS